MIIKGKQEAPVFADFDSANEILIMRYDAPTVAGGCLANVLLRLTLAEAKSLCQSLMDGFLKSIPDYDEPEIFHPEDGAPPTKEKQ